MLSPASGMQEVKVPTAVSVVLRVTGAVLGSYGISAALVALLAVGLTAAGLARSEAVVTASLLGFVLYLVVVLWAFSVRSLARLWVCLGGGTALLLGLALLLQRQMPY
ncbi:MAG: iron uptake protein [Pseudomonadota bacterium]